MNSSRWVLLVSILVIVGMAGCPGTDTLTNSNGTVSFQVVAVGDTAAWDCAVMALVGVNILPQDGTCEGGPDDGYPCFLNQDCSTDVCAGATANAFVGQDGFPIVTGILGPESGVRGNLLAPTCDPQNPTLSPVLKNLIASGSFFQPEGVTLPAGLYKLSNIRVRNVFVYDDGGSVGIPGFCDDCNLLGCLASNQNVTDSYTDNDRWFTVQSGQAKVIRFELNVDELSQLVNDLGDCTSLKNNIHTILPIVEVG